MVLNVSVEEATFSVSGRIKRERAGICPVLSSYDCIKNSNNLSHCWAAVERNDDQKSSCAGFIACAERVRLVNDISAAFIGIIAQMFYLSILCKKNILTC